MTIDPQRGPAVPVREVRTASVPEWSTAVSHSFVPLQVIDAVEDFRGRMRGRRVDDIFLSTVNASAHTVERTRRLIHDSDRLYYKLTLQIGGTAILVQDGREAVLHPGDIAIYDTGRPYTLSVDEGTDAVVIMFPQDKLELSHQQISSLTAVPLSLSTGLGQMVSPFLHQVGRNLDMLHGSAGMRIVHTTVDLVATMLTHELTRRGSSADDRRAVLMFTVHDFINRNLASPDLGPESIARASFISVGYLHSLFRARGTTVNAWIRERRLEHARRDLIDPLLAHRSIAAIAAGCGFPDAAHFSKVFRAVVGVSASEYRASAGEVQSAIG